MTSVGFALVSLVLLVAVCIARNNLLGGCLSAVFIFDVARPLVRRRATIRTYAALRRDQKQLFVAKYILIGLLCLVFSLAVLR